MMQKKILILGASGEMVPLMELARREGYQVRATDRNPRSEGLAAADIPFSIDASDLSRVMGIATGHQVDAILTRTELLLPVVAEVCARLGLPGPSRKAAAMSVDKYLFREEMAKAGIRTPKFASPTLAREVRRAILHTGLPAIVKPVDFSGSTGVRRVNGLKDAEAAFQVAMEISPSRRVIVEELLEGKEVSVETWTEARKTTIAAITDKIVSGNGRFVELRHTIPAALNNGERAAIEAAVQQMTAVMELNHCLTHTEVMLTSHGPVIIETGARPGGDLIGLRLVELATGISMNKVMLYLATGRKLPVLAPGSGAAAIQFVTSDNKHHFDHHHPLLVKDPNFVGFCSLRDDDPGRLHSSADRLAWYLFKAPDLQTLSNTLKRCDE
jgi:biotin carboxylase